MKHNLALALTSEPFHNSHHNPIFHIQLTEHRTLTLALAHGPET